MKIIGRFEKVTLPTLELQDLDAKVDTGADTSALHCDHIKVHDDGNVSFRLLDKKHEAYNNKSFTLPLHKLKRVKSSNGKTELRPYVKLPIEFFGKKYITVISLTNREKMKYPMLLGRKFLGKKFLVDVSQIYLTCKD